MRRFLIAGLAGVMVFGTALGAAASFNIDGGVLQAGVDDDLEFAENVDIEYDTPTGDDADFTWTKMTLLFEDVNAEEGDLDNFLSENAVEVLVSPDPDEFPSDIKQDNNIAVDNAVAIEEESDYAGEGYEAKLELKVGAGEDGEEPLGAEDIEVVDRIEVINTGSDVSDFGDGIFGHVGDIFE